MQFCNITFNKLRCFLSWTVLIQNNYFVSMVGAAAEAAVKKLEFLFLSDYHKTSYKLNAK